MSNVESLSTNEINQRLKHIYMIELQNMKDIKMLKKKNRKNQGVRVIMKQK